MSSYWIQVQTNMIMVRMSIRSIRAFISIPRREGGRLVETSETTSIASLMVSLSPPITGPGGASSQAAGQC